MMPVSGWSRGAGHARPRESFVARPPATSCILARQALPMPTGSGARLGPYVPGPALGRVGWARCIARTTAASGASIAPKADGGPGPRGTELLEGRTRAASSIAT
jgi:hypothetical protein